jgi:hypothetical protein
MVSVNITAKSNADMVEKMARWGYVYGEDYTIQECQSAEPVCQFP